MFKRLLSRPKQSFFLFGPRGTGKSTWLKTQKFNLMIDLLDSKTQLDLTRNPNLLREMTGHLARGSWVVIDEVQKIPLLLDEVHALTEEKGLRFALTGSSARKLKRAQANLLAGRAINHQMFPLVYAEYEGNIKLKTRIEWGTLPLVVASKGGPQAVLEAYVENYLRQELIEQGIIRNLDPFIRFLQVAAILNGQILNVENIARESKVGRTTVDKYFQILCDTLIAYRLPAYAARVKVKEISHPKLYFFDSGVARGAASLTRDPLDRQQLGVYFETFILNEVRGYNEYSGAKRPLFFYGVSGTREVDLIIQIRSKTMSRPDQTIAVEMKYSEQWKPEWSKSLRDFQESLGKGRVVRLIGVYCGERHLTQGSVEIFPVDEFLRSLSEGEIF